jgi:hypothetical protein
MSERIVPRLEGPLFHLHDYLLADYLEESRPLIAWKCGVRA